MNVSRTIQMSFAVAAISFLSGCGTPTGPFKNDDGAVFTTPAGHEIVVVDGSPKKLTPHQDKNMASYAERKTARAESRKRAVEITKTSVELAKEVRELVFTSVQAELKRLIAQGQFNVIRTEIIIHVDGRPQISDAFVKKTVKKPVDSGALIALRAMLEKQLREFLVNEYYPKMVTRLVDALTPRVKKYVAEGAFSNARNVIWNASTTGIPEVDRPVREKALDLMHDLVNPTHWKEIEPKIEKVYKDALAAKEYTKGIQALKKIETDSLVKEYADLIDAKLTAVKEELKRLGVPEKDMAPILEKQGALISAAANIVDECDKILTMEEAKKEVREKSPRKDPALAEYYKRLDDFHDTLVKFDCTKENADRITEDLDNDLMALLRLLSRKAVMEDVTTGTDRTALQLGTRSLNVRIRKLVADRIEKLTAAKAAADRAAFLAKLGAAKSAFVEKVKALVAAGKFEEAREYIWNESTTGNAEWDENMFALGVELLRDLVNPADWARIEKEIVGTFDELSAKGDFEALRKFLEEYPLIRQHTVKLDEQLARVRAEAEALGADVEKATAAAKAACAMVTEAEALVDHLDQLISNAAGPGKQLDKAKLQKELDIYAKKLAVYHATPANVAAIVEKLRLALDGLLVNPTNPSTTHLQLGTNAVNDRIKKLVAELLAKIQPTKHEWENKEHERITTDLEKRVRKAVKEERFADARDYIRDEKLIGRQDLDLSLYVLRVGLLDSCVNPAQLDFLLAKIDEKLKELEEAKDYAGILEYVENYPYVHDEYEQVDKALAAVKAAMLALEISQKECESDEHYRFFNSIRELLEKRRETWKPERDLSGVEEALAKVAKALFDHLNKHPELIEAERKAEYAHILEDLSKLDRTITTWELNERLRRRLGEAHVPAKKAYEAQQYVKLVSEIDTEVSFDSQIAMAEDAIAKQLGIKCPEAFLEMNAVLGEYARAMRLLKLGKKLDAAQATTMLIGGVYLNQASVAEQALKLGADVNGVSDRDPLKRTALLVAIQTGHNAFLKQLGEAKCDFVVADARGNTALHYAVCRGNLNVVTAMLKSNDVNKTNADGESAIFLAVRRNQAPIVEALVKAKADVMLANAKKATPFDAACTAGSRDVLDVLAQAGAVFGPQQLIIAAKGDHLGCAQWLVGNGVDVNSPGVMAATLPKSDVQRYLVHEGGVLPVAPEKKIDAQAVSEMLKRTAEEITGAAQLAE